VPILLLLLCRSRAVKPWLTRVLDDGTRALLGWAITLTPNTATVLTALRMALTHDPDRGPFGAVPAGVRIDHGLEFAAQAVTDAPRCVVRGPEPVARQYPAPQRQSFAGCT
jgi:putative transposase